MRTKDLENINYLLEAAERLLKKIADRYEMELNLIMREDAGPIKKLEEQYLKAIGAQDAILSFADETESLERIYYAVKYGLSCIRCSKRMSITDICCDDGWAKNKGIIDPICRKCCRQHRSWDSGFFEKGE